MGREGCDPFCELGSPRRRFALDPLEQVRNRVCVHLPDSIGGLFGGLLPIPFEKGGYPVIKGATVVVRLFRELVFGKQDSDQARADKGDSNEDNPLLHVGQDCTEGGS